MSLAGGCDASAGGSGPGTQSNGSGSASSGGSAGSGASTSSTGGTTLQLDPGSVTPPQAWTGGCGSTDTKVLFVVDRSGSMNCNLPPITDSATCEQTATQADTTQPRKWDVMSQTLSQALPSLIPAQGSPMIQAGLSYFSRDDICGAFSNPDVQVAPMTQAQVDVLTSSLAGVTPKGKTPIVGATILAYKELYNVLGLGTGKGAVILMTDGADSCSDAYDVAVGPGDHLAEFINAEVPKALSVGIKTFVIGAPGSEPARQFLSNIAIAGGTARDGCNPGSAPDQGDCHYDMTTSSDFGASLTEALSKITGTISCVIQ